MAYSFESASQRLIDYLSAQTVNTSKCFAQLRVTPEITRQAHFSLFELDPLCRSMICTEVMSARMNDAHKRSIEFENCLSAIWFSTGRSLPLIYLHSNP